MSYQYDTDDNDHHSNRFLKARSKFKNEKMRSYNDQKSSRERDQREYNNIPNFSNPTNQYYITDGKIYEYCDLESDVRGRRKVSFNEDLDSCHHNEKILNESSTFNITNSRSPSNLKQDTIHFGYLQNNPNSLKSSSKRLISENYKCSYGTFDSKNMIVNTTEQSDNNMYESPKHISESDYEFHATPNQSSSSKYKQGNRSSSKRKFENSNEQPRGSNAYLAKYRSNFDSVYER